MKSAPRRPDSPAPDFPTFLAGLARGFGEAALTVRHEIYFTATRGGRWRPRWSQALRGLGALGRTVFQLYCRRAGGGGGVRGPAALVTLGGPGGWGTIGAALAGLAAPIPVFVHPRLGWRRRPDGGPVRAVPRPAPGSWRAAWRAARAALAGDHPRISAVLVAAGLMRGQLWQGVWRQARRDGFAGPLLLHNDFDLPAAAACAVGLPTLCLQHGIPTDEFFPARATVHVVWGESSAAAYRAAGVEAARIVCDGLGRARRLAPLPVHPPARLVLLSQTHTGIYGPDLPARLAGLAAALAEHAPGDRFEIWLHPAERRAGAIYGRALAPYVRAAPHPTLSEPGARPCLIAGFCSTALLEAAAAGHWVVGLEWDLPDSQAAQKIGRPPWRVADAPALLRLWAGLGADADAESRAGLLASLAGWRAASWAPDGALARHLDAIPEPAEGACASSC